MNRSSLIQLLQNTLEFLEKEGLLVLAGQDRSFFSEKAQDLLEEALHPAETLYVALLGGTGVGKSTLINALAGKEISHSSDRRPFTQKAVAYRHRNTPRGLEDVAEHIRNQDAVHDSEIIKDLVILDLPDFDSVQQHNRQVVLDMLPHFDCIIWVVSPEKYGDASFYELVAQSTINRDNFTFVFNKADELLNVGESDRYGGLKDVLGDFAFRLRHEAGIETPRIFSLSALHEFRGDGYDPLPAKEFVRFKEYLMVRRDAKEIDSIKTTNLVEEVKRFFQDLNSATGSSDKSIMLRKLADIEIDLPGIETLSPSAGRGLKQRLAEVIFPLLISADQSIMPVRWAMRMPVIGRRSAGEASVIKLHELLSEIGLDLRNRMREDLDGVTARMDSELIYAFHNIDSSSEAARIDDLLKKAVDKATALFLDTLESRKKAKSGWISAWTTFTQKFVLAVPVFLLIIKLSGDYMTKWLESPSFVGIFKVILGSLTAFFGSDGLVGLAALMICEFILIWYLAAKRSRRIERYADASAESAVKFLHGSLDSVAQQVKAERTNMLRRLQSSIEHISLLNDDLRKLLPKR